jgi:glutamyl-tRNA reductase
MEQIKQWANENMQFREQAIADCMPIIHQGLRDFEKVHKERQIEKAMVSIPETIKEIRNTALGSVFAKDLETLDDHSREVLEKIVNYIEKKYISIPMKMAKDVLLDEVKKN